MYKLIPDANRKVIIGTDDDCLGAWDSCTDFLKPLKREYDGDIKY